ncbi:MAG: sigma-54-dependent Fis family transcriptional regulator [Sporichthyaceae bacterium]
MPLDGPGLLRASRERFLATGHVPAAGVREEIAASWRRSRLSGVDPDRLELPYEPDRVNRESRLRRAANPVMERFAARLVDTPTGLFLADREARGVGRWVGQAVLADKFDAVGAADGFRFDEEIAGTNALGTTVELGKPVKITASEHWVEQLSALTCAGAPIRNPITRQIEGIVDLTCVNEHNADLLLALVLEIAHQVEERFYLDASVAERLILQNFSSAARNSSRPVMALNQDMILTNPAAARMLPELNQELLWDLAARVMHADRPLVQVLTHEEESTVAHCTPVRDGAEIVGVTIELKRDSAPRTDSRTGSRAVSPVPTDLPGLVGRSPAWRGVCQKVRTATLPGRPLVLTGEPGVGKLAVAQAWLSLRGVSDALVLDAAAGEIGDVPPGVSAVVLAHAERLASAAVYPLSTALAEVPLVAITVTTGAEALAGSAEALLERVGGTRVDITPLRSRREDVLDLAVALGAHAGPELTQLLMRLPLYRNVRELAGVLEAARANRPTGQLRPDDLPQHVRRAAGRRMLGAMEQAEFDAIVRALDDAAGNKVDAAAALGISRSTLYRKMQAYGVDLHRAVF